MKTIKLTKAHRGPNSTMFTGRPQGSQVREELNLNQYDKDEEEYEVSIPEGTTSFNPSFYLGLFYESIRNLGGIDKFHEKYKITYEDKDPEVIDCLKEDIADNERQALIEYKNRKQLMDNLPFIPYNNDSLMNQPFIFTYQPLDSTYYSKKEDDLRKIEKIISKDSYANLVSTIAIIVTLIIFIIQSWNSNKDRKKQIKQNWFMSVIIQPNLDSIDKFYNQVSQSLISNISVLQRTTDGRFIPRQKARANRALRNLRNNFFDNFVTIVQSYDTTLATKINKTINDLQDLCSRQIDNYPNADNHQIKKGIYENRATLISLLYEGIKGEEK